MLFLGRREEFEGTTSDVTDIKCLRDRPFDFLRGWGVFFSSRFPLNFLPIENQRFFFHSLRAKLFFFRTKQNKIFFLNNIYAQNVFFFFFFFHSLRAKIFFFQDKAKQNIFSKHHRCSKCILLDLYIRVFLEPNIHAYIGYYVRVYLGYWVRVYMYILKLFLISAI